MLLLCASIVVQCIVKNRAISFDTSEKYVRIQTFKFKPSSFLTCRWVYFREFIGQIKRFSAQTEAAANFVLQKTKISGNRYAKQIQLPDLESTVQSLPVVVAGASLDPVFLFKHRSLVSIVV